MKISLCITVYEKLWKSPFTRDSNICIELKTIAFFIWWSKLILVSIFCPELYLWNHNFRLNYFHYLYCTTEVVGRIHSHCEFVSFESFDEFVSKCPRLQWTCYFMLQLWLVLFIVCFEIQSNVYLNKQHVLYNV